MIQTRIISLIPYKILPANLGGEKGIASFNEYLGKHLDLIAISVKSNDISKTRNYQMLNNISDKKIRYINAFLYFKIRKLIKDAKATHFLTEHPYFGWLAYLLKKTVPITWIVHSHNIEYQRFKSTGQWWWRILKIYEKWVYKTADVIFFISDDDRRYAIEHLKVQEKKSFVITYGVDLRNMPQDNRQCREKIMKRHSIKEEEKIILFNGALYHEQNYNALKIILEYINPELYQTKAFQYKIIICGKGLPGFFNDLLEYRNKNIIYAGFVNDISTYFKAADLFINPIIIGGGIKTKVVEAIAYDCSVVSTEIGALGLAREICGNKISIVPNNDWQSFTKMVLKHLAMDDSHTPPSFYDYYSWENIVLKAKKVLEKQE